MHTTKVDLIVHASVSQHQNPSESKAQCILCGADGVPYIRTPDRFYGRAEFYDLLRCGACSLVWLSSPPSPEEMANHYGCAYDGFVRRATEHLSEEHWRPARDALLRYKSGGTLLDVGCGGGSFLRTVQAKSWSLYGIELSAVSAKRAATTTGATVFNGDVLAAPFPAETFDAITCFHLLEHVYDPKTVLERVWNWLKPGGVFCVQVPNIEAIEARVFRSYWYPLELPRHLYQFSPSSLRKLSNSVGLRELSLRTSRVSFIEYSTRYLRDDILRRLGWTTTPLAFAKTPSRTWRVLRKGLRLTVLPMLATVMAPAGRGQIIEAVLEKHCAPDHHQINRREETAS